MVTAKKFDSNQTVATIRGIASTLTAYSDLEGTLRSCPAAAVLVTPLSDLMGAAHKAAVKALAAGEFDQRDLRAAAVQLFALLPADFQLSTAATQIASDLGRDIAIAKVPEWAAEPIGSLPPLPTPAPPATPAPEPTPLTVALPKLSEKVVGASKITYFSISGDAPNDLADAMERGADRFCTSDALACVKLDTTPKIGTSFNPYTGSCTVTSASLPLTSTVYLPRWTKPSRVYPALVSWWRKVLDHIAWHEGQHIKIEKSYLTKMKSDLIGEPCSRGQTVINSWRRKAKAAQAAFDDKERRTYRYPAYSGPGGWYGS